ncbi:PLP-dependent aminotransferase family protein [Roseivirga sp. E12]|uniref:aminotransferase-like domain-containing protein n=1 Tax=Roseivirga sp. E12 TaxID=2819237 RepID=UPI001ABC6707|nr:PLP-dependent aminotransferase family protein [Roseivirga sp. E12]MBO3700270.1 PLP-dependent aminotransferase family protein [Roseivirga sp. E12]
MLPYKTIIKIDRDSTVPLYLQVCNEFIKKISCGEIASSLKLPGSRSLSDLLGVNRRTIISAYEELEAQGWLEVKPNQGCFVSSKLPISHARALDSGIERDHKAQSIFELNSNLDFLEHYKSPKIAGNELVIDAGYPDVRLAPMRSLTKNINGIMNGNRSVKLLNYSDSFNGDLLLRKQVVKYLAETRSINVSTDNLMITRGSLMAFSNIFRVLLGPGDKVIVGDVSFKVANDIIRIAGGDLVKVPLDNEGIDVHAIEKVCQKEKIRAVFIMPHHHNPTTVSLSAERRMKLLMLAEKYQFAIIEDDYDYDFHYNSSPILPMSSSDRAGSVIYVGSLSKTVAPGLRTGFIVAPANFIRELSRLSRFIDCHGNMALERAIAVLFEEGEIRRHMKKALKAYHIRRDLFCDLLKQKLGNLVSFQVPEGGLAVWVTFDDTIDLPKLREVAIKNGLLISKSVFSDAEGNKLNAIRMGFASLNEPEIEEAMNLLEASVKAIRA